MRIRAQLTHASGPLELLDSASRGRREPATPSSPPRCGAPASIRRRTTRKLV
jgi:hypothetical protein